MQQDALFLAGMEAHLWIIGQAGSCYNRVSPISARNVQLPNTQLETAVSVRPATLKHIAAAVNKPCSSILGFEVLQCCDSDRHSASVNPPHPPHPHAPPPFLPHSLTLSNAHAFLT